MTSPVDLQEAHQEEALAHASTLAKHARDLLHAVIGRQDYHAQALLVADYAQMLADHASGATDTNDYEHTAQEAPESTPPLDTNEEAVATFAVASEENLGPHNIMGTRFYTELAGTYTSIEEAKVMAQVLAERTNTSMYVLVVDPKSSFKEGRPIGLVQPEPVDSE